MCHRLSGARSESVRAACTVLTLIGTRRHRELVHRVCQANMAMASIIDVSSATDAVLTLLAEPVDVLLVDAKLAGDLLGAMLRHARHSAPMAKLAVFGSAELDSDQRGTTRSEGILPWHLLESTLRGWLILPLQYATGV